MAIPLSLTIQDYIYDLPEDRIAGYPLDIRDSSKLLHYRSGSIQTRVFSEIPDIIGRNRALVFNNTKVIQARIQFKRSSGASIEVFLLEPSLPADYEQSLSARKECTWKCLIGNARKWKGEILAKEILADHSPFIFKAEKTKQIGDHFLVRFFWEDSSVAFGEVLDKAGITPIPPYLNRGPEPSDHERYQTIYSRREGSVAAPTAGLHFTDNVLTRLNETGQKMIHFTLHVGAGTFLPVKTLNVRDHLMHTEHFYIRRPEVEELYNHTTEKIIAVGTTSVRMLESIYHFAGKIRKGIHGRELYHMGQWEGYQEDESLSRREALATVLEYMNLCKTDDLELTTAIMIVPGYTFRMTDALLTNFHQPGSTLLLLIAAFTGEDWKNIYRFALDEGYRFLSYGDSSFLER